MMVVNNNTINKEYMNWLENFSIEHPSFHDDEFLFIDNGMNKKDRLNVLDLDILYRLVELYAKKNNIKNNDDIWTYYILKYNDNYYKLIFELDCVHIIKLNDCKQDYLDYNEIEIFQQNMNKNKANCIVLQKNKKVVHK